jgi:hypothetical protein
MFTGLADRAPRVEGVIAVWVCSPCLSVGKFDVPEVNTLPLVLLWVPVLQNHDVIHIRHSSASCDLKLHVCSRAKAVLSQKVGGNAHSSCELIVVGW